MSTETAAVSRHPGGASLTSAGGTLPGWLPPLIAAAAAILSWLLGWRGVDLPAQIYRVSLFHRAGLTLWDSQWYGGHWTLDYSVIFPPVAGVLGLTTTAALSACGAALAFDRLVVDHFGPSGRVGSVLFAVGTTVQLAIGQLPFLMGEALALGACWAAARRRWPLAVAPRPPRHPQQPAGRSLPRPRRSPPGLLAEWPRRRWAAGADPGRRRPSHRDHGRGLPGPGRVPLPAARLRGRVGCRPRAWRSSFRGASGSCAPRRSCTSWPRWPVSWSLPRSAATSAAWPSVPPSRSAPACCGRGENCCSSSSPSRLRCCSGRRPGER